MSDYYRINILIFIKPNLPDLRLRRLFFLKLTLMVVSLQAPTRGVRTYFDNSPIAVSS